MPSEHAIGCLELSRRPKPFTWPAPCCGPQHAISSQTPTAADARCQERRGISLARALWVPMDRSRRSGRARDPAASAHVPHARMSPRAGAARARERLPYHAAGARPARCTHRARTVLQCACAATFCAAAPSDRAVAAAATACMPLPAAECSASHCKPLMAHCHAHGPRHQSGSGATLLRCADGCAAATLLVPRGLPLAPRPPRGQQSASRAPSCNAVHPRSLGRNSGGLGCLVGPPRRACAGCARAWRDP